MSRLRWRTFTMSTATRSVVVPNSALWRATYATFALQISFLLGMQLMFGHEPPIHRRSEEHTSELQSQSNLVCRLLLEKKKKTLQHRTSEDQYKLENPPRLTYRHHDAHCSDHIQNR